MGIYTAAIFFVLLTGAAVGTCFALSEWSFDEGLIKAIVFYTLVAVAIAGGIMSVGTVCVSLHTLVKALA